jgi:adenylosuccinate synthase
MQKNVNGLSVVYGGQWGSEGKGQVLAAIVRDDAANADPDRGFDAYGVRVGGPNAGHTVRASDLSMVKIQSIPSMCFAYPNVIPVIGAGGLINPEVLEREIDLLHNHGYLGKVLIDPNAMMVLDKHIEQEHAGKLQEHIGSTREGVGAALAEKIRRQPGVITAGKWGRFSNSVQIVDTVRMLNCSPRPVYVEGTQGYLLSLHTSGYYPFCTSRECGPEGILADVGLTTRAFYDYEIVCVLRTFPIRVGGNSGELPNEVDWEYMAQHHGVTTPERTTVTNRIRRIAKWDNETVLRVVQETRPTSLAITFLDYLFPDVRGVQDQNDLRDNHAAAWGWICSVEETTETPVRWVSTGPGQENTFRVWTNFIPF